MARKSATPTPQKKPARIVRQDQKQDPKPVLARTDQWGNPYSGMGGPVDRRSQTSYHYAPRLSSVELSEMWRGDDICAKLIEKPADEAWKQGFTLSIHEDSENASDTEVDLEGVEEEPELAKEQESGELPPGSELETKTEPDPNADPNAEKPVNTSEPAKPGDPAKTEPTDPTAASKPENPNQELDPDPKKKKKKRTDGFRWVRRMRQDAFGGPPAGFPPAPEKPKAPKPIVAKDEGTKQQVKDVMAKWNDLQAEARFTKLEHYARCFGGGAIFVGVDGNQETPLNLESIQDVKFLTVFAGGKDGEIHPVKWYDNAFLPKYGEPEIYEIRPFGTPGGNPNTGQRVHESRLLVMRGPVTDNRHLQENNGWGDSVIVRMFEVLRDFAGAWGGTSVLIDDFATPIYKIKGLSQALAQGMFQVLQNRIKAIHMSRSSINAAVLDAELEDFGRMTTTLTGLSEVLTKFEARIAAACDMPVTVLFGVSPGGLNATGKSDLELFYNTIATKQVKTLQPLVERLLRMIFRSKAGPTGGVEPDDWDIEWKPLWSLSAKELEDMRLVVAQRDQIYFQIGLTAEEIIASRFAGKWSPETQIDNVGREDLAAEAEFEAEENAKQMQAMAKNMPKYPTAQGGPPFGKPVVDKPASKPAGNPFGGAAGSKAR